jgi:hypothetical protein
MGDAPHVGQVPPEEPGADLPPLGEDDVAALEEDAPAAGLPATQPPALVVDFMDALLSLANRQQDLVLPLTGVPIRYGSARYHQFYGVMGLCRPVLQRSIWRGQRGFMPLRWLYYASRGMLMPPPGTGPLFPTATSLLMSVQDVMNVLKVSRSDLGLEACGKGVVRGRLVVRNGVDVINCLGAEWFLPGDRTLLSSYILDATGATHVLVCEKHSVLAYLYEELARYIPGLIMVTGRGYADLFTRCGVFVVPTLIFCCCQGAN